jgi:hypothetical protein
MAFSRPKAIGGLAVDDDYRDDAQSAFVVCRNQLWNPFSVVFVLRSGARWDVSVAPPVVSFVSRAVDMLHYAGMSLFKIGILLLNLVPYVALHIIRRT